MYEPSIRVPMAIRYPARIKGGSVDRTHMVLNVDVAPTLLQLAGVPVPQGLHGRSMLPLLLRADVPWRDAFLMFDALKARGADVRYTEYPGVGHNAWDPAYATAELWAWMLAQRAIH